MTAIRGQPLVKDQIFFRPPVSAGITDHTLLSNIGVNTHPQIDTHIADTSIHGPAIADGTSADNTLRWSGAAWVETSNVTIDPVGAVDLEFNSVLALRTTISGISVHPSTDVDDAIIQMIDNSGEIFRIEKSNVFSVGVLFNEEDGFGIVLQANNISSTPVNMLAADPDTSVDLFFNGVKAFASSVDGADVFDTTGGNPVIFFFEDDLTTRTGFIQLGQIAGDNMHIRSEVHGASFNIEGEDAGGVLRQLINCDPDGSVDLFFDGTLTAETAISGLNVHSTVNPQLQFIRSSALQALVFHNNVGDVFTVRNQIAGANILLTARNAGDTVFNTLLEGDPDGAVDLYFDGTLVCQTTAQGIQLFSTGATTSVLELSADVGVSTSINFEEDTATKGQIAWLASSNQFRIRVTDATDSILFTDNASGNTMAEFIDGGAVDLYFDGEKVMFTDQAGISVKDLTAGDDQPRIQFVNDAETTMATLRVTATGSVMTGFRIIMNQDSAIFTVQGADSTSVQHTLLTGDPDGTVDLYFDGAIAAVTQASGLSMYESAGGGGATSLQFFNQAGVTRFGNIQMNNGTFGTVIFTDTNDEDFTVLGDSVAQGALTPMIIANPDTGEGVELYAEGVLELDVVAGIVRVVNDLEIDADLNHDGTNIGFYGTAPAAQSAAYTRNATIVEDRTLLQSSAATALNNNNVLAALIADLQAIGLIG